MNTARVRTMNDRIKAIRSCARRAAWPSARFTRPAPLCVGTDNGLSVFFIEHSRAASGRLGRIAQCGNPIRGASACFPRVAYGTLLSNAQTDYDAPRTISIASAHKAPSIPERDRFSQTSLCQREP